MTKQLVVVTWADAKATQAEFYAEGDVPHEPATVHTAGWLLKDDELGITIANEWFQEEDVWRGTTFVPRAMVLSVKRLGRRQRRQQSDQDRA